MPRFSIDRATNFIVEQESWTVVEYDYTSVPGVIYLSLTEGKVNLIYDDLQNNIADIDKLADYSVLVPAETQTFAVNDIINPVYTLTKNGVPFTAEVELTPEDKTIVRYVNGVLTAKEEGITNIIVSLKDYPNIKSSVPVEITASAVSSAYIEGVKELRLDRITRYTLITTTSFTGEVVFSIDTNLATIIEEGADYCVIRANNNNLLGTFTLTATYNNIEYTKEITIIPLW